MQGNRIGYPTLKVPKYAGSGRHLFLRRGVSLCMDEGKEGGVVRVTPNFKKRINKKLDTSLIIIETKKFRINPRRLMEF